MRSIRQGMESVTFETDAFRNPDAAPEVLSYYLMCLYGINKVIQKINPNLPRIYQSGIRYKAEARGLEKWIDAERVIAQGNGDCEDLATWRAAELTVRDNLLSIPIFRMHIIPTPKGPARLYHIMVKRSDGVYEDPSYILGMRPGYHPTSPASWAASEDPFERKK